MLSCNHRECSEYSFVVVLIVFPLLDSIKKFKVMKVSRDVEGKFPLSSFLKQFLNVKVKVELYAYKNYFELLYSDC